MSTTAPRLAIAPAPPPRPDPTIDAVSRAWAAFFETRDELAMANEQVVALAKALGDRDATIAALQARQRALADLCWSGWVVALTMGALLVVRMLWGL